MIIKFGMRILRFIESPNPDKHYIEKLLIQTNKNKHRIFHTCSSLMILQENKNFYLSRVEGKGY